MSKKVGNLWGPFFHAWADGHYRIAQLFEALDRLVSDGDVAQDGFQAVQEAVDALDLPAVSLAEGLLRNYRPILKHHNVHAARLLDRVLRLLVARKAVAPLPERRRVEV